MCDPEVGGKGQLPPCSFCSQNETTENLQGTEGIERPLTVCMLSLMLLNLSLSLL